MQAWAPNSSTPCISFWSWQPFPWRENQFIPRKAALLEACREFSPPANLHWLVLHPSVDATNQGCSSKPKFSFKLLATKFGSLWLSCLTSCKTAWSLTCCLQHFHTTQPLLLRAANLLTRCSEKNAATQVPPCTPSYRQSLPNYEANSSEVQHLTNWK